MCLDQKMHTVEKERVEKRRREELEGRTGRQPAEKV